MTLRFSGPAIGLLTASALLLSACTTEAERRQAEAAQAAADRQECRELGFDEGTEAFANCLLKLKEIRATEAAAAEPSVGFGLGVGFGF